MRGVYSASLDERTVSSVIEALTAKAHAALQRGDGA